MLVASFLRRISFWLRRRNLDRDFQEEISQHLELKIHENIASGMSPAEAQRAAHLEFGNPALAHERSRASWGFPRLESVLQDLRYAARQLRRQPAFALVAILTLTLGIGINVAVFSLVNAILLTPLRFHHSDRLVDIAETEPAQRVEREEVSYPNLLEFTQKDHSLRQLAAYVSTTCTLRTAGGAPERVTGAVASANLFSILGATFDLGSGFAPESDRPGSVKAVILSHSLWHRRFGADTAIIGKTVLVDDDLYTVVGIAGADFGFPSARTELWLSLGPLVAQKFMQNRGVHILSALGQLKEGTSAVQAAAEIRSIAAGIQQQFPGEDPGHSANVVPLKEVIVGGTRPALLMLAGAVLFVLLIVSANLTNLLLSRVATRGKEMAIRKALGATRARILRQLFTENLLLSTLGAAFGLLLAKSVLVLAHARLSVFLPRMQEVQIDSQVLMFALALSLVTGMLFGMAPALHFARNEAASATSAAASGNSHRFSRVLVVAEIGITLVLLAPAGLLMKSFQRVLQVDRGFDSDNLLTMTASLPAANYQTAQQVSQFFERAKSGLERIPGIREVSGVSELPMNGGDSYGQLTIEGQALSQEESPAASFRRIFPNYFQCLKIPILQGRIFQEGDDGRRQMVVMINQSMARRFWPAGDAVGKRIKVGPAGSEPWLTIVGVVGDVRNETLDSVPRFATYEPYLQRPRDSIAFLVRTVEEPMKSALTAQHVVREAERNAVIYDLDTMEHRIAELVYPRRFLTSLSGVFAFLALALAAIGLYGVLSYWVGQRTREIGIRMALGAAKADVLKGVLAHGLALIILGLILGTMGAIAAGRLLTSFLFAVTALDLEVFVLAVLLTAVVAGIAAYLPARRATEVDPIVALRYE